MSELAQTPSRLTDAQRQLLAARLRKGRTAQPDRIQRRPAEAEVPLSFAQEQLWFLDRFAPGLPTYNIPHLMWLSGRLDLPALDRAVTALVSRHESLRTRLVPGSGDGPRQVIDEVAPMRLPVIELAEPDLARARAEARSSAPSKRYCRSTSQPARCSGCTCSSWPNRSTRCSSWCTTACSTPGRSAFLSAN